MNLERFVTSLCTEQGNNLPHAVKLVQRAGQPNEAKCLIPSRRLGLTFILASLARFLPLQRTTTPSANTTAASEYSLAARERVGLGERVFVQAYGFDEGSLLWHARRG